MMNSHDKPSILNTVSCMDIFDLCDCLEDDSIDMILCDLPYGITACEWDTIIPFELMWECFKRIIKPRGAIVLTASGKFTYKLVASNFEWFKYEWVWRKNSGTNFLNTKIEPMKEHEQVLIFCRSGHPIYFPQYIERKDKSRAKYSYPAKQTRRNEAYGHYEYPIRFAQDIQMRVPSTILKYNLERGYHPTQKPVALFEYLIRTYAQPGDVVFDPCIGSGTTAIAARNSGRNFICGDSSEEYVQVARDRLAKPYTLPMFEEKKQDRAPVQTSMFE